MKIIAIDPGNEESAYVIYEPGQRPIFYKVSNDTLLCGLNILHGIDAFVIEMVACYGMAVGATVFETCCWIGRFEQRFADLNPMVPQHRVKRMEVKMHLCGQARAKDGNIRQALIDRFGEPGTKKHPGTLYKISGDCWAALALAVTWADKNIHSGE